MIVEPVKKKDINIVFDLLQSISEFYPSEQSRKAIWKDFIKQDRYNAFTFFEGKEIIGYGCVLFEVKIRGGKMAHIEDIVVSDKHRGKGYGKAIIEYLVEFSRQNNCYKASLNCKEHNIKFYKECNFIEGGITMNKILK